jgi:hypothetical protein
MSVLRMPIQSVGRGALVERTPDWWREGLRDVSDPCECLELLVVVESAAAVGALARDHAVCPVCQGEWAREALF